MRVDYINPFVESTVQILKETVNPDVKRGQLSLRGTVASMMGVVVIVGLAGQVSGRIIIDMEKKTAMNIVSKMNDGEKFTELDEMATATLTELANMITGKAITKLHDLGFQFDITPPALFSGDKLTLTDNKVEVLVVPIEMPEGRIEINVGIKES